MGDLGEHVTCHLFRFLIRRLHDTTACQSGCTTGLTAGLTTGCIVVNGALVPVYLFSFFTLFLGSRRARTGRPILTIYTSYDVYPRKEVPFGVAMTYLPI